MQLNLPKPKAAEFFAGIGLIRAGLESEGFDVVFSNDVDTTKKVIYEANYGPSEFVLCDVRAITGNDVPDVAMATASFPCTDVSLAGARAGFKGKHSSLVAEFLRVLGEMEQRKPQVVVLENVVGFVTSNKGEDLRVTVAGLNDLGYVCDILVLDAARFVPQSRPRLFIVGWRGRHIGPQMRFVSDARPAWLDRFVEQSPMLAVQSLHLPPLPTCTQTLEDMVDRLPPTDSSWWKEGRLEGFLSSLSPIQSERLAKLSSSSTTRWATAYRRTRNGNAVWEIRADEISGCLRTGKGGSSRQALVEAGRDQARVRWMTAREYSRLQGAPEVNLTGVTENQARFAFGDAVCVPAIAWLARHCLMPLLLSHSPAGARLIAGVRSDG